MNLSQKPLKPYRKNKLFYSRININAKPLCNVHVVDSDWLTLICFFTDHFGLLWKSLIIFVFLELFLGMANCSRLTPAPKQLLFQIKGRLYVQEIDQSIRIVLSAILFLSD